MIAGARVQRRNFLFIGAFLFAIWILCIITISENRHVNKLPATPDPNKPPLAAPKSAQEAWDLCKPHGFRPHNHGNDRRPRRVYDLFLFSQELDWLEIRLNQLDADVDYFVIVESPSTFTGLEKPLLLEQNWSKFAKFHHKIIRKTVTDPGAALGSITWKHEEYMRNSLFSSVFPDLAKTEQEAQEGDVLVVSDVDEIPRPETLMALRHCDFPDRLTLRSAFYYYSFQWSYLGDQWPHPQATNYHGLSGTILPSSLRASKQGLLSWLPWNQKYDMPNAAWHCSSCFHTIAEVRTKMESFSHTPLNTEFNRQPGNIVWRVREGTDLYGRKSERYEKMFVNPDVPKFVSNNSGKYEFLFNRDGMNAGFKDAGEWNMTILPKEGMRWLGQGDND